MTETLTSIVGDVCRFITKKYSSAKKQLEAAPATACTGALAWIVGSLCVEVAVGFYDKHLLRLPNFVLIVSLANKWSKLRIMYLFIVGLKSNFHLLP